MTNFEELLIKKGYCTKEEIKNIKYEKIIDILQNLTSDLAFNHMCLDVTACSDKEWRLKADRLLINYLEKLQNLIEIAKEGK